MKREPQRRCISCRLSSPRSTLLRFVYDGDQVVWDTAGRAQGRGAYVHRREMCWSKMRDTRMWNRAFRLQSNAVDARSLVVLMDTVRPEIEGLQHNASPARVSKIRL